MVADLRNKDLRENCRNFVNETETNCQRYDKASTDYYDRWLKERLDNAQADLKALVTQALWDFTDKHCSPKNETYPYSLDIMQNVLLESLAEVRRQKGILDEQAESN